MPEFSLQQPTPFGPVTTTVLYSEAGTVLDVSSSAGRLSPVMLKLTFGDRAEIAAAYFSGLVKNVRFSLEAVPFLDDVPAEYAAIQSQFTSLRSFTRFISEDSASALRIDFWRQQDRLRGALFLTPATAESSLQRMAGNTKRWTSAPNEVLAALEPWVMTLFDLVPSNSVRLAWEILGRLGTANAADAMLAQLERPGVHPQGTAILTALSFCFEAPRDAERLLALGHRNEYAADFAKPYLHVVAKIISPAAVKVATYLLEKQVEALPEALAVFEANGVSDPLSVVRAVFWSTEAFWVVFRYVELLREVASPDQQISLDALNRKLAERQFLDTAPVVWQQQLSESWKTLLDEAPPLATMALIEEYITRPEARLKYNALLQLNYVIRQHPEIKISAAILNQLQTLISHRFDKVAALAISAIRKLISQMEDWTGLNERLMAISATPGFRVAKLKLLKQMGARTDIAAAQRAYFHQHLNSDLSPDEKALTKSIIKYLKLS
ncbi:hypothetical protein [Neolewinella antarctica]|uniref:HEAT repeat domain-containing protein n=1 Tax=Neolewinella antarctica TaxID=442734 RepID=A0ABX0X822_9BACT|nr:hypothetical protein [Neolewinella antarctica]NJC24977.1 hypothetical protein [Neolewinella antarctica]